MKKTNSEIFELKTDVAVIKTDMKHMKELMVKMDKAISGNGQPGLIQNLKYNADKLDSHIVKDTEWKGRKDGSISGIKWFVGIGFTLITAIIACITYINL